MESNKCPEYGCNEPLHDDKKCIFHCDKTNWYTLGEDGTKNWVHDELDTFWQKIEDKLENAKSGEPIDFRNFIFPADVKQVFSVGYQKNIKNKIYFDNSVFLDDATFQGFNFENFIALNGVVFTDEVSFFDCDFEKDVEFYRAIFLKNITFVRCSFRGKFTIASFYISKSSNAVLTFNHNDIGGNFDCTFPDPTKKDSKSILEYSLKKININDGLENLGLQAISILGLNINDKATCRFDLSRASVDKLTIDNSNSLGLFHLANVDILESFSVNKSIFSKNCVFDNIKLKNADKAFREVFFSEATFINIEWGSKAGIKADREHFRQLKYAYDKQANYIEANEFYALEMKAREEELKNIKGFSQDKFIFLLGGLISNHSTDWLKALRWIFCFGIVMFFWYQWQTDKYVFDVGMLFNYKQYYSGVIGFLDDFAKFMNPFSKKLDEHPNTGYAIWLTHKVFSGFLIYHFIVSLRRNTKR